MKIFILEDNLERREVMQQCLADRFWQYPVHCFADAPSMIAALTCEWNDVLFVSLDHDLDLIECDRGVIDPGTGRDVADFLAERSPICPVLIHTSNGAAAVGMEQVLHDGHWQTMRVTPYGDTRWIWEAWFPAVRELIVGNVSTRDAVRTTK